LIYLDETSQSDFGIVWFTPIPLEGLGAPSEAKGCFRSQRYNFQLIQTRAHKIAEDEYLEILNALRTSHQAARNKLVSLARTYFSVLSDEATHVSQSSITNTKHLSI